jgi:hypothetical protein
MGMRHRGGGVSGRDDRWPSARLPAAAIGLVLMEWALTDVVGSPVGSCRWSPRSRSGACSTSWSGVRCSPR